MLAEAKELMAYEFPFLHDENIGLILDICAKNNSLIFFPELRELLGFYRFYPELIDVVRHQDFDILMQCDLTMGPFVYVAALVTPGDALRTISMIVRTLNARAYAFHRYKHDEYEFHFVRNNRYAQTHQSQH